MGMPQGYPQRPRNVGALKAIKEILMSKIKRLLIRVLSSVLSRLQRKGEEEMRLEAISAIENSLKVYEKPFCYPQLLETSFFQKKKSGWVACRLKGFPVGHKGYVRLATLSWRFTKM
jgi:hypothetical protein